MTKMKSLEEKIGKPFYIVTTGTGRQGKAHVPTSPQKNSKTFCNKQGKNWKKVDSETVNQFYDLCERCLKKMGGR